MNEEKIKKYLDEAEQRLQRLEDEISRGNVPGAKPEKDKKEQEINEFIEFLKKTNGADPAPEEKTNDENDFIQMMKDMNQ
jgi:DNA-directed RNA polymerase beta' subunit